jgi:endoplasmic reticulum-Golgi intermediate compartment protein 2
VTWFICDKQSNVTRNGQNLSLTRRLGRSRWACTMSSTPSDALDTTTFAKLDAFPKIPSTYKARSESRGIMTLFVAFLAFMLVVNDIGEYIWGWPDFEFSVDDSSSKYLSINIDLVVAMPCGCK